MLTDEEIKAVALKAVGESKAGQAFVSIIAKACHVVLTLDKQMVKPTPKSRSYNVGDILRSREDRSVTIRLVSLLNEGYWWVSSKRDGTRIGTWTLNPRTLDSDWEPVPAEPAKHAPAPARKPWPKGPVYVAKHGLASIETQEGLTNGELAAAALALTEFPAAVAIIRESAKRGYQSSAIQFIARVDAAGFDLSITGEAK